MEKTSKCVKRVVYVCPTPDNCGYFEQYKDKPFCCKYRTDGNAICTCKEAIEEAKGQPKRNPLPDGTLSLTDEELEEFGSFVNENVYAVIIINQKIYSVCFCNVPGDTVTISIDNIKAILYLANLFDLTGEK